MLHKYHFFNEFHINEKLITYMIHFIIFQIGQSLSNGNYICIFYISESNTFTLYNDFKTTEHSINQIIK